MCSKIFFLRTQSRNSMNKNYITNKALLLSSFLDGASINYFQQTLTRSIRISSKIMRDARRDWKLIYKCNRLEVNIYLLENMDCSYGLENRRFGVRALVQNCISLAHLFCSTVGTGALSRGIKRPGREADHSSPASAEVKKTYVLVAYCITN
jgi:hypothetical protein